MFVNILFNIFSPKCFDRYCNHICITYIILTKIIITFNWYRVTATQLTTCVPLYSCNNNITMNMAAAGLNTVNISQHNISSTLKCILLVIYIQGVS
jgi:hypothetical protein